MTKTLRGLAEEVLTPKRTKTLWTANYHPAIPFAPQGFEIGAMLPAVLYMFRWGHRRGKGNFAKAFARPDSSAKSPTVADVASGLVSQHPGRFDGFDNPTGQALLADLLLTWCVENRKHAEARSELVQRVFPTHYLMSWIDLPETVNHLRHVPETLVSLLVSQAEGQWLEAGSKKGLFGIASDFSENILLSQFGRHMRMRGSKASSVTSDEFVESNASDVGIDELLAVRMAQVCGQAPEKARGADESERIPNRWPLASVAAESLREDLAVFIEAYGTAVPRQGYLQMLESAIGLGLTNILLTTCSIASCWERNGYVPTSENQEPMPVFVDCSLGQDRELRHHAEDSFAECLRRFERLPVLMMLLRVLDDQASNDRRIKESLPPRFPDATDRVNLLGAIYRGSHDRSKAILERFEEDCCRMAEALEEEHESGDLVELLSRESENPALRFAEALCQLMGDKLQRGNFAKALDSALMTDRPHGLAMSRRVRRTVEGKQRMIDLRSMVLTHPMIDFLVHRHLRKAAKGKRLQCLSFKGFLAILRDRYGLYVEEEPPGQPIAMELLLRNKAWLERRLRDLGLLIGVNDAESMKQLRPRYGEHP